MATWGQFVEDIMLEFGWNHDDAEKSKASVLYNVRLVAARLLQGHVQKNDTLGPGQRDSDAFMCTYVLDVQQDEGLHDRYYFDLPTTIFDMDKDGAIRYITYFLTEEEPGCPPEIQRIQFSRTTADRLYALQGSTYQRPSPKTPYFIRANSKVSPNPGNNRVYLFGVEELDQVEVGLFAGIPPMSDILPTDDIPLPDELLYILKRHVLDLGRWSLALPVERLRNDGRDFERGETPLNMPKMVSVNDPSLSSE